jgi:D-psicose/D-tagatose/L-ribulose 3-epimerase
LKARRRLREDRPHLDEIGLERTAITVIPTLDKNPAVRRSDRTPGSDRLPETLRELRDALGSRQLAGPLHQTLGHFSGAATTDKERARAREVHHVAGDYAAAHDMRIVLEAINRFESYFANTMHDLAAYLDTVDHPAITGMYDTFHANIEELDPVAAFTDNIRHISYVHISENDRGVPGRGHVPWAETFRAIKRSGYDGWLTIEAFGRGLPELAAATRVWRDFAESPRRSIATGSSTSMRAWRRLEGSRGVCLAPDRRWSRRFWRNGRNDMPTRRLARQAQHKDVSCRYSQRSESLRGLHSSCSAPHRRLRSMRRPSASAANSAQAAGHNLSFDGVEEVGNDVVVRGAAFALRDDAAPAGDLRFENVTGSPQQGFKAERLPLASFGKEGVGTAWRASNVSIEGIQIAGTDAAATTPLPTALYFERLAFDEFATSRDGKNDFALRGTRS